FQQSVALLCENRLSNLPRAPGIPVQEYHQKGIGAIMPKFTTHNTRAYSQEQLGACPSISGFRWPVKGESDSAFGHEQDIPPLEDRRAAVSAADGAGLRWSGPSRPLCAEPGEGGHRPLQDHGHLRQRAGPAAV